MQSRTVDADTCMKKLNCFLSQCLWLTVFTHFSSFHRQVSPGHSRSLCPALPSRRIPPDDCGGPVIPWPRASGVYISLMDLHSNLHAKTHPSCKAEPLENPSPRHFSHVCPFKYIFLECFFFSILCYLSQNKIRTKRMSALNLYAGLLDAEQCRKPVRRWIAG